MLIKYLLTRVQPANTRKVRLPKGRQAGLTFVISRRGCICSISRHRSWCCWCWCEEVWAQIFWQRHRHRHWHRPRLTDIRTQTHPHPPLPPPHRRIRVKCLTWHCHNLHMPNGCELWEGLTGLHTEPVRISILILGPCRVVLAAKCTRSGSCRWLLCSGLYLYEWLASGGVGRGREHPVPPAFCLFISARCCLCAPPAACRACSLTIWLSAVCGRQISSEMWPARVSAQDMHC